jgi:hypothetical protein
MAELDEIDAPENPLDEQLTAYLDGELSPEEARALEQQLARDITARERLRELASAWDMLDSLPRSTVSDNFAKSTVAMVAVVAADEIQELKQTAPTAKNRRWIGLLIGAVAASVLGYFIANALLPDPHREIIKNLTLLDHWRIYQELGSLDFLRQLEQAGLFVNETENLEQTTKLLPVSKVEREQYLNQLSDNQREELRRRTEEFLALPATEQKQLAQLDKELQQATDANRLTQVMLGYHNWLNARTTLEISDLKKLPSAERIAKIKDIQRLEDKQWAENNPFPPNMIEDYKKILTWMSASALKRESEILRQVGERQREFVTRLPDEARAKTLLAYLMDNEVRKYRDELLANMNEEQRRQFDRSPPERIRYFFFQLLKTNMQYRPPLPFTETEIAELERQLSPATRKQLEQFQPKANSTPEEIKKLAAARTIKLWEFVGDAMRFSFYSRSYISEQELQEFLASLPDDTKRNLTLRSPEDMKQELRRMYAKERGIGFGMGGGHFFDGRGGDNGPRPPRPGDGPPPKDFEGKQPGFDPNGKGPPRPRGEGGRPEFGPKGPPRPDPNEPPPAKE